VATRIGIDTADRPAAGQARPDDDAFAELIESHRRDLVLLCYRFLGSLQEAEEAAQETALRAWRGRSSFRGASTPRTWLHRIATRVCLDLLAQRSRRVLPAAIHPAADPRAQPHAPLTDVTWLEPIPDDYLVDATQDPAARYTLRESVSLAFLAALQDLPARQRAVLILRDVLAWSAAETADALEMSLGAANSALHRARSRMRDRHHTGRDSMAASRPDDPRVRRLLDAYVRAWEADDVDGLVATLKDDVRLAMPPSPSWYAGREAVAGFLRTWLLGSGRRFRLPPLAWSANGQPAVGFVEERPEGRVVLGIQVLAVDGDGIADITSFMDPVIAARFGVS
jgi:RNA polymerase sigma-70 factor (ECF subfamily)